MTLTIELTPEVEQKLAKKAMAKNCAVADYVENLIEKDVDQLKSLEEIFAPLHKQVEESGISDEKLDELFTDARRDYYAEKKAKESR